MDIKRSAKRFANIVILGITIVGLFCTELSGAQTLLWGDMYLEELPLSVRDSCSDHACFLQAAAREDGAFIIVSRNHAPNKDQGKAFYQVYVDIYDSSGSFLQEFTFPCPLDFTAELSETYVHMYFYSSVLSYHIESGKLECREIPPQSLMDSGLYKELRKTTFICGEWEYRYVKKHGEYTGLIRSNGEQEQVLVDFSGTGNTFWITWIAQMALCIAIVCLWRMLKKRKQYKKQK